MNNTKYTCISLVMTSTGGISGYKLKNLGTGKTKIVATDKLQHAMLLGEAVVDNLVLNSNGEIIVYSEPENSRDNRIIITRKLMKSIEVRKDLSFKITRDLDSVLAKLKLLGFVTTVMYKHLIVAEGKTEITLISDTGFVLSNSPEADGGAFRSSGFRSINLENVDSSEVINMTTLFMECEADSIDISALDTSNVTDMKFMFCDCKASTLELGRIDTSKVTIFCSTFAGCEANVINLSHFKINEHADVTNMFKGCASRYINLDGVKLPLSTREMFVNCKAADINFNNVDSSDTVDMRRMFAACKTPVINLRSFSTPKLVNMTEMFDSCQSKTIYMQSFDTSNVKSTDSIFCGCDASIYI